MSDPRIDDAIVDVAARIGQRTAERQLTPAAVEALDVVYHAVVFTRRGDALELWRSALWSGVLEPAAEEAMGEMLAHLFAAVDRGRPEEVSRVCDCLVELVGADASR
jgi:hypothetical protein